MSIKGTRTEKNLLKSFAGEAQARMRYTYYASAAKKEGYVQISDIFEETANQEKEHGKRFYKFLEGGELEITSSFPAGIIGTTIENLKSAAKGELEEYSHLYPGFADVAAEEGFEKIAAAWRAISISEKQHEKRFNELRENIEKTRVFHREDEVVWRCRNCGYLHTGKDAPEICPACIHARDHFELLGENW